MVHRRGRWLTVAAAFLITVGAAEPARAADPKPPVPSPSAGWLTVLNYYRSLGGFAPVNEDASLSQGAREHARYIVETGRLEHNQDVPSPHASEAGREAAENGNLYGSNGTFASQREPIDGWADSLGHGLTMLRPTLQTVGYGSYAGPDDGRPLRSAAVLNVYSAPERPRPAVPMPLPRDGTVVSTRAFPNANPSAIAACPGFEVGAPILYVFFPEAPSVPAVSVTRGGTAVRSCGFSAANYNGDATIDGILEGSRVVAIVLGEPLRPAATYSVTVLAGQQAAAWSFEVANEPGYWLVTSVGEVLGFGGAVPAGDAPWGVRAADIEASEAGGYWVLDDTGRVYAFGGAVEYGYVLGASGRGRAVSIAGTLTGRGYWVFTANGHVFHFGDARMYGSLGGRPLNGEILDSVATPTGRGYYMVAADGGVFAFGDARFAGSMGGRRLNAPVRSLVPDPDGDGYWLVASDGGVFAFRAPFRGSMGGRRLNAPVVGMVAYGNGYAMVAADGGVFVFSNQRFLGSLGDRPPSAPVVAITANPAAR